MVAPPSEPSADTTTVVPTTKPENLHVRTINGKDYQFPAGKPLYSAHGKWEWVNGHDILSGDSGTPLGQGLEGHVTLKAGLINETEVVYISKMTSAWDNFRTFFSSLYLNASSKYLRPLQGDCVPWIIGVRHCLGGRIGVAQDLPHPTGWREADMFLEESQKEAIIAAYQRLHDRGILHGDAEYRHMLLGDDDKVTIIDFGLSSVLNPDEWARKAGLDSCSQLNIRTEMRKVKFLLNWKSSRETELRLAKLRSAREERDRAVADAMLKSKTDPLEEMEIPKEPMSEEEKEDPDGGLLLSDLKLWSYGDTWVAHRYEVERRAYRAVLKKTMVPRPPIPARKRTEFANIVASAKPVFLRAEVSAIRLASTVSAGATDTLIPTVSPLDLGPLEGEAKMRAEGRKEQKINDAERTMASPLRHGKAGESDRPVMTHLLEDEPVQKQEEKTNVDAKHTKAGPLGYDKVGCGDGPEEEPELKEGGQKVNEEHTKAVSLKQGEGGESDVLARKRSFESELEEWPEEQKSLEPTVLVFLRHNKIDRSGEPARNRSSEERSEKGPEEQMNADTDRTKAVHLRHDKSDHSEPARKRRKTGEALVTRTLYTLPAISSVKRPLIAQASSLDGSMSYDTTSDVNNIMKIPLLDDDAADPTPYELNPEACAFLREEAARGLARFTTAKMRVLPLERQLDQENHKLEKHRSELLRMLLMLPREDRTNLWTNMGQPDIRTLLGLLPETPGPSKLTRDLIRTQTQLARSEAVSQRNSSNGCSVPSRKSDPGFLALQTVQAKTGSKQKLHERLEIERKVDSLAMPAPPLPIVPSQKNAPEVPISKVTPFTSSTSPMVHSPQRNTSQGGITSESSPSTLQGLALHGPTQASQPASTSRVHSYNKSMKKIIDEAHKANPDSVFSVSIPSWEGKSTRKYTLVEEPSQPQPGTPFVRTPPAFDNGNPIEITLAAIREAGSKLYEAKRKREITDPEDSEGIHVAEELPDAKRRKIKNCDLL